MKLSQLSGEEDLRAGISRGQEGIQGHADASSAFLGAAWTASSTASSAAASATLRPFAIQIAETKRQWWTVSEESRIQHLKNAHRITSTSEMIQFNSTKILILNRWI